MYIGKRGYNEGKGMILVCGWWWVISRNYCLRRASVLILVRLAPTLSAESLLEVEQDHMKFFLTLVNVIERLPVFMAPATLNRIGLSDGKLGNSRAGRSPPITISSRYLKVGMFGRAVLLYLHNR